jgi:hypothetical protein
MHLRRGTVEEGEKGMERNGEGVSICTANQRSERTGIRATTHRRDFQISKGRVPGNKRRDRISKPQKGIIKRIGACISVFI